MYSITVRFHLKTRKVELPLKIKIWKYINCYFSIFSTFSNLFFFSLSLFCEELVWQSQKRISIPVFSLLFISIWFKLKFIIAISNANENYSRFKWHIGWFLDKFLRQINNWYLICFCIQIIFQNKNQSLKSSKFVLGKYNGIGICFPFVTVKGYDTTLNKPYSNVLMKISYHDKV